jgi:uncharacterized protein
MSGPEIIRLQSDGLMLHGVACRPATAGGITVLFLHGGGTANAARYRAWQEFLAVSGIGSLALDFRGCGKSEGRFESGSLANRLRDAASAYDYLSREWTDTNTIVIAGSSMGGHVASRLTGVRPASGLILQSAAAYGKQAEPLPLDETFTAEIRKPGNYADSPAIAAVNAFAGPVLCVYGGNDDVIPKTVQHAYMARAERLGRARVIHAYGHTMLRPETDREKQGFLELLHESHRFLLQFSSRNPGRTV